MLKNCLAPRTRLFSISRAMDRLYTAEAGSPLEWITSLDTEYEPEVNLRKCSIIGTIGPKTNKPEILVELRKAGLNIARMNFSHGTHEYHKSVIDNCRKSEELYPARPLAIALDTKGPEIRTGNTRDGKDWDFPAGHEFILTTDDAYAEISDAEHMYVDYKNITKVLDVGKLVYVDDGVLQLKVLQIIDDKTILVKAFNNGTVSSKKGVNLPKTDVDLPALSEKDIADIKFGVANHVDMIFASFIRTAADVRHIRSVLGEEGKDIKIIVKIENHQGVRNFDDILKETDGVMVARGDLGIEIPPQQVFLVQKQLIAKSNLAGKPVICATQMLDSMIRNPRPTRAEVSDVGNAVLDGADCVMLSGETAKGSYPEESVSIMREICLLAEQSICYNSLYNDLRNLAPSPTTTVETVAMAAVGAAFEQRAGAIVVLSTSGGTARLCAKYRPVCPILMVTRSPMASRYCHLYRGVYPFVYEKERASSAEAWQLDVEERIHWGIEEAIKLNILKKGSPIVTIQGWKTGGGHSNTLRIVYA